MSPIDLILERPVQDHPDSVIPGPTLAEDGVLEALDALAEACQIRPLESFLATAAAPARGRFSPAGGSPAAAGLSWHDAADGLHSVRILIAGLQATLDPDEAIAKGLNDLERFAETLETATAQGIRFHLAPRD